MIKFEIIKQNIHIIYCDCEMLNRPIVLGENLQDATMNVQKLRFNKKAIMCFKGKNFYSVICPKCRIIYLKAKND